MWSRIHLRSRSLDLAGTRDSGQRKKAGKVFGSLERGLDKVITMLTPSKRRGLRDGPRKIKVRTLQLTHSLSPLDSWERSNITCCVLRPSTT
jgi:hypothetical protein